MCIFALFSLSMMAQDNNTPFSQYKAQRQQAFNQYKEHRRKEFEEFRRKRNEEFAEFMRKSWDDFTPKPVEPKPKDETIPPIVAPKDDDVPINRKPKSVPFEEVIPVPTPQPQPQPIKPIEEIPITPVSPSQSYVSFMFFGTPEKVRFDKKNGIRLNIIGENNIADAWLKLSEESYTNLIYDCLEIRRNQRLCDWAYLMMLNEMAESVFGERTNESVLLMAYVYCQSGYQMRLAIDNQKLILLVASKHQIFELPYFTIDGSNYYPFLKKGEGISERVQISRVSFPQEKTMSLLVTKTHEFAIKYKEGKTIKSEQNPNVATTVKINQNLISFYSTYPTSMLDNNIMTKWSIYANTPLSKDVKEQLYPQLKPLINDKTQLEAVNILLNWVQTGFEYEYDDKVWEGDRVFFAEESLNYPFCDCEDRSILFTRLVRDLIGLKCILVFYPGHLAAAVNFTDSVNGDYIQLNGQRYIVSDPTYIGASVGMTMPEMDNKTAKVILLE
jgi:hypothetical protein